MKKLSLNIKLFIVKIVGAFGYELVHKTKVSPNHSMRFALVRIKKLYNELDLIIDIGASDGSFSNLASEFWPDSTFYLFDPLKDKYKMQGEILLKEKNKSYC